MTKKTISAILTAVLLASCAGGTADKDKAKNDYRKSLSDSITAAQKRIDSCESRITLLTEDVSRRLQDFSIVDNAKEVESYYILTGWQNRYPLQSTGLVARISNGESLELIAALKGSTFNSIKVESGSDSAASSVVPHDQALNYRREGLNTVMFAGEAADSVARLIADNAMNPVKVVFLENGDVKGSWQMPDDYKEMVSATWTLYSSRRQQMNLEANMKLLHKKIEILRTHIDKE